MDPSSLPSTVLTGFISLDPFSFLLDPSTALFKLLLKQSVSLSANLQYKLEKEKVRCFCIVCEFYTCWFYAFGEVGNLRGAVGPQ